MAKNTANTSSETTGNVSTDDTSAVAGMPDFDSWVESVGGFPPYFQMMEGRSFYAKPVMIDVRQEGFPRIVFEALAPVDCYRGSVEDAAEVEVQVGELFTVGLIKAFEEVIFYMGMPVKFTSLQKKTQAGDKKKSFWEVSIKVSPDNFALLNSRKSAAAHKQLQADRSAKRGLSSTVES